MPDANIGDVRNVIATDLDNDEIDSYLQDAEFEAEQAIGSYDSALTTEERTQLEKYLAALRIREIRDRAVSSTGRETASVEYEGMSLADLRRAVNQRDPSGTLAYQRDTSRYHSSTDATS